MKSNFEFWVGMWMTGWDKLINNWFGLVWFCWVWFGLVERVLMSDHFWLDLVVLVLSNFVCSVLFGFSWTKKKKKLGLVAIGLVWVGFVEFGLVWLREYLCLIIFGLIWLFSFCQNFLLSFFRIFPKKKITEWNIELLRN